MNWIIVLYVCMKGMTMPMCFEILDRYPQVYDTREICEQVRVRREHGDTHARCEVRVVFNAAPVQPQ